MKMLLLLLLLPTMALAAITHVGSGTAATANNTNVASPTIHASTTTGDVVVLVIGYTHDNADGGAINAVSGYTLLEAAQTPTGDLDLQVRCKVAGASESSPSVSASDGGNATGDVVLAQTFTLRGALADCSQIVAHVAESTTTGNVNDLPHVGLSVSTANTAVIAVGAKRDDVTSVDTLATDALAWSEVVEASTTNGDDVTIVADLVVQTTAVTVGAGAFTLVPSTGQTGRHASILLSLKPAAGGGPGSPPAGKTDYVVSSVGAGTWLTDVNAAATPDIVATDTVRIDSELPGGVPITHGTDGKLEYFSDGSRKLIEYEVYDASASAWMAGGPALLVLNNGKPSCDLPAEIVLDVGSPVPAINLNDACSDPEQDALTYAVTNGALPAGVSLIGATGALSGIPTGENEAGADIDFTATDPYGATAVQRYRLITLDTVTVPSIAGGVGLVSYVGALDDAFLSPGQVLFACSGTIAAGDLIETTPAPASEVEPFTAVNLLVSTGQACGSRPRRLRFSSRRAF